MELQVQKEWCKVSDATVRFTVASNYQRSSWDWVAIYKVCFTHHLYVVSQFDAFTVCCRAGGLPTPQRLPGVRVGQGRACNTGAKKKRKIFYFLAEQLNFGSASFPSFPSTGVFFRRGLAERRL